jgi:hypothetical protein
VITAAPVPGGVPAEFEDVWPLVERRLRALLYRRGLDQASSDDVVQEVALRVLAHGVTYESSEDLLRWAAPVACRLHVDLLRHRARITDADEAPEHPARDDVAGEVADRLELQRAFRAIATLRPADRDAIIDAVAAEPPVPRDRQEAVRLAVRRHRARSRLAVVLEQLAGWIAGLAGGWRVLAARRRSTALAALVPAAAAIPLMVTFAPHAVPLDPQARPPAVANAPEAAPRTTAVTSVRSAATSAASTRAALRRAVVAPVRKAPAAPRAKPDKPEVDVDGPNGIGLEAGQDARRPDDRFLCVNDVPEVDDFCVL